MNNFLHSIDFQFDLIFSLERPILKFDNLWKKFKKSVMILIISLILMVWRSFVVFSFIINQFRSNRM